MRLTRRNATATLSVQFDILKDKRIPAKDSIWAAYAQIPACFDDRTLRLSRVVFVRYGHLLTDERSQGRGSGGAYAVGEATDEELAAARDAAMVETRDATRDAAMAAAWAAIPQHGTQQGQMVGRSNGRNMGRSNGRNMGRQSNKWDGNG